MTTLMSVYDSAHLDGLRAADEQDDGADRTVAQQEVGRLQQPRALLHHQEVLLRKTLYPQQSPSAMPKPGTRTSEASSAVNIAQCSSCMMRLVVSPMTAINSRRQQPP